MELPYVGHLGITIDERSAGASRCTLAVARHHLNSSGAAHGGAVFSLADTAMGAALLPTLAPGQGCATIEIKINYFRPAVEGMRLTCTAALVHRGRSVANLDARVHAGDVLVARANGSFSIFERHDAAPAEPTGRALARLDCPLCGSPNDCAAAQSGDLATPCWCADATFAPGLLARVPAADAGRACICPACVAAASRG